MESTTVARLRVGAGSVNLPADDSMVVPAAFCRSMSRVKKAN